MAPLYFPHEQSGSNGDRGKEIVSLQVRAGLAGSIGGSWRTLAIVCTCFVTAFRSVHLTLMGQIRNVLLQIATPRTLTTSFPRTSDVRKWIAFRHRSAGSFLEKRFGWCVGPKGSEDGTQSPRECEGPREFFQCHSQALVVNTGAYTIADWLTLSGGQCASDR